MIVDLDPRQAVDPLDPHGRTAGELLDRRLVVVVGQATLDEPSRISASAGPSAGSMRVSPMYSGFESTGTDLERRVRRPSSDTAFIDSSSTPCDAEQRSAESVERDEPARDLLLEQDIGVDDVTAALDDVARAPERVDVPGVGVARD